MTAIAQALPRAGTFAAIALLASVAFAPAANAVPCGNLLSGGVAFSIGCRNGADGDLSASVADFDAGNFFGFSNWQLLDTTSDGVDNNYWSFLGGNPHGMHIGIGSLAAGIWDSFSSLSIVLEGRGGAMDRDVKWAAYQMIPGNQWFAWTYDYLHKLGAAKLFGVVRSGQNTAGQNAAGQNTAVPNAAVPHTTVPEPATLALVALGLVAGTVALRRRRQLQAMR